MSLFFLFCSVKGTPTTMKRLEIFNISTTFRPICLKNSEAEFELQKIIPEEPETDQLE